MLWALKFTGFEYIMKTRGSKEYMSEIIRSKGFGSIGMIQKMYEN